MLLAVCVATAALHAHDATTARLTFVGGHPHSGQRGEIRVQLLGLGGAPVSLEDTTVRIIADMTMHAMTPVEADLTRHLPNEVRGGDIAFTMPGEWRITLRLEEQAGTRVSVFPLTVLRGDAVGSGTDLNVDVGLEPLPRPTIFDPWTVVWVSLGLVVAAETTAIVFRRRRVRQQRPEGLPLRVPGPS